MISLLTFLLPLLSTTNAFEIREATDKGCGYGDSCWPNSLAWNFFNFTVGGRVKTIHPLASVCHTTYGEYDAAKCAEVTANWEVPQYSTNFTGGYSAHTWGDGYGDDFCSPTNSGNKVCGQGRVPPVFVEAESVTDLVLTLAFVRLYNLKVRVKSTGHSLTGGSSAKGALGISVHKFKDIKFHSNFKDKGTAVTVGAGVQFFELYEAAYKAGVTVIGGGCDSVSISGYTLGGGHSRYSPTFGLSVDQVLEFTIVTPQGLYLTVNPDLFPDLWWAVRGGGSGFGIITSWTMKTHPAVSNELVNNFQIVAPSQETYQQGLYQYLKVQPALRASKWSDLAVGQSSGGAYVLVGAAFKPNVKSHSTEEKLWDPIRKWAASTPGVTFTTNFTLYPSQHATTISEPFANQHVQDLSNQKLLSRLLDASIWKSDAKLVKVANFLGSLDGASFLHVPGGAVSNTPSTPMALNPAWRTALSHVLLTSTWPEGSTKAEQSAIRSASTDTLTQLTSIIGTDASYVNESDPDDPTWPHNYFGDNYARLLAIKKKWDPTHVFTCTGCVGSEKPAGVPF